MRPALLSKFQLRRAPLRQFACPKDLGIQSIPHQAAEFISGFHASFAIAQHVKKRAGMAKTWVVLEGLSVEVLIVKA